MANYNREQPIVVPCHFVIKYRKQTSVRSLECFCPAGTLCHLEPKEISKDEKTLVISASRLYGQLESSTFRLLDYTANANLLHFGKLNAHFFVIISQLVQ